MIDYRKIFEDFYELTIPDGFVIHHIDEDRENNDISNLMMMPSTLHSKYHQSLREFLRIEMDGKLTSYNQFDFSIIRNFADVLKECQYWMLQNELLKQQKSNREEIKRWLKEECSQRQ